MHISTVSAKRQITLPKHLLDRIGVKQGQKIFVSVEDDSLIMRGAPESLVGQLAGSLKKHVHPSKLGVSIEVIRKQTQEEASKEMMEI